MNKGTQEKVSLQDLCNIFNVALVGFEKYKIHTHSDFHKKVRELLEDLFPLDCKVSLAWNICLQGSHVISYRRDFEKYKNSKYADRGNFKNVRCYISIETRELDGEYPKKFDNNMLLSEVAGFVAKKDKEWAIKCTLKAIEQHEKEKESLKKKLSELTK